MVVYKEIAKYMWFCFLILEKLEIFFNRQYFSLTPSVWMACSKMASLSTLRCQGMRWMAMLCVRARLVSERSESLLQELSFLISGSGPKQLIRENYSAIIRSSCIFTKSWYWTRVYLYKTDRICTDYNSIRHLKQHTHWLFGELCANFCTPATASGKYFSVV